MNIRYVALAFVLTVVDAAAGNSTMDSAIGGGIGGAAGAAIGNEIGGREGAILGGALGGAIGVAVNTDADAHDGSTYRKTYYRDDSRYERAAYRFCPPGQAKKGRC